MTGIDYHLPPIKVSDRAPWAKNPTLRQAGRSWHGALRHFGVAGFCLSLKALVVEDPRQLLDRRSGSDEARAVCCCLGPGVNCGFLRYFRCGVARTSITSLSPHTSTKLLFNQVCQEALLFGCPQGTKMWEQIPADRAQAVAQMRGPTRTRQGRRSACILPRSSLLRVALDQVRRVYVLIGAETSITSNVGVPLQSIRATRPYVTTLTGLCRSSESPVPTVTFKIAFTSI